MDIPIAQHNRLGKRILGEEEWQRQQEAQKAETRGGVTLGRRIMQSGDAPAAEETTAPEATAPAAPNQPTTPAEPQTQAKNPFAATDLPSIASTETILAAHPELFDDALEAEMFAPSPRKGVLQVLLRIEKERPDPREVAVKLITAELEELEAGG